MTGSRDAERVQASRRAKTAERSVTECRPTTPRTKNLPAKMQFIGLNLGGKRLGLS